MEKNETPDQQPTEATPYVKIAGSSYSRTSGGFGKLLSTLGAILFFTLILTPIGLVFSLIGYLILRRRGMPSRLALFGLLGNGLLVFIGSTIALYLIFLAPELIDDFIKKISLHPSTTEVIDESKPHKTEAGKRAATEVAQKTTQYKSLNGVYPLMLTDFERNSETSLKRMQDVIISVKPLTNGTGYTDRPTSNGKQVVSRLELYTCGATEGNKIGYWDIQASETAYQYSGAAGANSTCAIMK